MQLTGEYTIPAPREKAWAALNDAEVLKACISGCEKLDKTSATEFTAKVTVKVGAVKARFKGSVTLSDIDAPNSYTISGQGQGGVAGFAKGSSKVFLEDASDGGTILRYDAKAEIGGKLAAVGSRVIQGVAKKSADDFFGKFAAQFEGSTPADTGTGVGSQLSETAPTSTTKTPATAQTSGSGITRRDLLWLAIGIAVGAFAAMAFAN